MTIHVTQAHIQRAVRGSIDCPVYLAAQDAGLDVSMVGVGTEHYHSETPSARMYLNHGGEPIIQPLPANLIPVLKAYDKTGVMEPLSFDIPLDV
jgi:hypothetical protein